jgi:hypothetical protein
MTKLGDRELCKTFIELTNLGRLVRPVALADYRGIPFGFHDQFPETSRNFSIFVLSQGGGLNLALN